MDISNVKQGQLYCLTEDRVSALEAEVAKKRAEEKRKRDAALAEKKRADDKRQAEARAAEEAKRQAARKKSEEQVLQASDKKQQAGLQSAAQRIDQELQRTSAGGAVSGQNPVQSRQAPGSEARKLTGNTPPASNTRLNSNLYTDTRRLSPNGDVCGQPPNQYPCPKHETSHVEQPQTQTKVLKENSIFTGQFGSTFPKPKLDPVIQAPDDPQEVKKRAQLLQQFKESQQLQAKQDQEAADSAARERAQKAELEANQAKEAAEEASKQAAASKQQASRTYTDAKTEQECSSRWEMVNSRCVSGNDAGKIWCEECQYQRKCESRPNWPDKCGDWEKVGCRNGRCE